MRDRDRFDYLDKLEQHLAQGVANGHLTREQADIEYDRMAASSRGDWLGTPADASDTRSQGLIKRGSII